MQLRKTCNQAGSCRPWPGRVDTMNLTQWREGAKMRLLRRNSRFFTPSFPRKRESGGLGTAFVYRPLPLNFGLLQPRVLMSTRPGIRFIPAQGQDLPRRATRRPQAPRQPNPRPARNGRQNRDRPLRGKSHGCPTPALRLRERLQAMPGGSRPRRTNPADARMGCALREHHSRRLRSLHIAHERMARRPARGTKRAPKTCPARTRLQTVSRTARRLFARDCGVEATVADDLDACKPAADRLGIDHRICISRAKNRARNRPRRDVRLGLGARRGYGGG